MVKLIKLFIVLAVMNIHIISLSAQDVDIFGTVKDQNAQGVAGASVSLPGMSMTTTTGADGTYKLDSGTGIHELNGSITLHSVSVLNNGILKFNILRGRERVKIGIYNLMGKQVTTLLDREMETGEYSINLFSENLASKIYFLRIMIGRNAHVVKVPVVDKSLLQSTSRFNTGIHADKISKKRSASLDSIIVQKPGYSRGLRKIDSYTGVHNFTIVDTAWFWGDISSIPQATKVMTYAFLNRTNGAFPDDKVFWQEPGNGQWHSIAQQRYYDMGVGSSGRLNFSVGEPGGDYWDFEEHTIGTDRWNGNTTRVDGWRLPFAIRLHCSDGYDVILGEEYHIFFTGRDSIFQMFKDAVPVEFDLCADNGYPYRIIAPGKGDGGFGPGQQYASYMTPYLQQLGYGSSTTEQVFACAGTPFGGNAQLAGAVNRHVAHLDQSQWGNAELFYLEAPANFYAKFWHEHSFDNKCYGFAYDDAEGQAAYASHDNPEYLIMAIGY